MTEDNTKEKEGIIKKIKSIWKSKWKIIIALIVIVAIEAIIFFRLKINIQKGIATYISIASIGLTIVLFLIKSDRAKANAKDIRDLGNKKIDKEDEKIVAIDSITERLEALESLKEIVSELQNGFKGLEKKLESLEELKGLNTEFNNFKELFDNTNKKLIEIQVQDRKPILGLKLIKVNNLTGICAIDERPKNKRNVCNAINEIPVVIEIQNKNQQFNIDISKIKIKQLDFKDEKKLILLNQTFENYQTIYTNGGRRFEFVCHSDNIANVHNFVIEIGFNKNVYDYNLLFTFSYSVINLIEPIFYNPLYTVDIKKVKGASSTCKALD